MSTEYSFLDILLSGDFEQFLGFTETNALECKRSPYDLEKNFYKQELAKDVSAFANASGGFIVVGLETEKSPNHFGDEIKKITSCPSI